MSRADVEIVRYWADAFNERDIAALIELTDPACELRPYLASLIETTSYQGHQGLRDYFDDADKAWEEIRVRLRDDFRPVDDCLVGSVEIYGRARASGLEVSVGVVWVAELREKRVARIYSYETEADALAAVGG
jgi:ketosteroid isomerase-like protein